MDRHYEVAADEHWERFLAEAKALGVQLPEGCVSLFASYLVELQEWNRSVRLVSRADAETVLWRHFLDSLALVPFVEGEGPLLDVGSGAGFPGIPVKLAKPFLRLHLVEPRRRKANFLRHLVRVLGLKDVCVYQGRAGKEGLELGRYPLVVARAVASPLAWLEMAETLVEKNGRVFLMLAQEQATKQLDVSLVKWGWQRMERVDYKLPNLKSRRSILVLKRA